MRYRHPYWTNYSASENGSVYGSRGGELSPMLHHTGYSVITVRREGEQKQLRVHRFIWEYIHGLIEGNLVINHKNGIKTDNRLENLELLTNQENTLHCWRELGRKPLRGEKVTNSKLTEDQAVEVIRLCEEGVSNQEIGKKYGLHPNYVSLIRHNKRWRHLPRNK